VPHRALACVLALVLVGAAGVSIGREVPYVWTPHEVVAEMLRLAVVGPGDVVYDLGSGDGRVVIAAARDFGARASASRSIRSWWPRARSRPAARASPTRDVPGGGPVPDDLTEATVVTLYCRPS